MIEQETPTAGHEECGHYDCIGLGECYFSETAAARRSPEVNEAIRMATAIREECGHWACAGDSVCAWGETVASRREKVQE